MPTQSAMWARMPQAVADGYWTALDSRILKAAAHTGANLASVSGESGGAFPSVVAERLVLHGLCLPGDDPGAGRDEAHPPGPELHVAEFEWYFTGDCAHDLADFAWPRHGQPLLLGTPTVAAELGGRGRRAATVDRSPFLLDRFGSAVGEVWRWDLRRPLGRLRAHPVVLFDAPWYEDHIGRWLWQASLAVRRGGCIAFALFGDLTRQAAQAERARLLSAAELIGRVSVLEGVLRYRTPLFEAQALSAAGHDLRGPWRVGDLAVIENCRRPVPAPPAPHEPEWITSRRADIVVKLDPAIAKRGLTTGKLDQRSRRALEPTEYERLPTLNTVSRSRIREHSIGLLTSRNRYATR